MTEWLYRLPVSLMGLVIFAMTYLGAAAIHGIVQTLASGERGRAFKAISPGIIPPLGIIYGLLVGFTAVQVWGDLDRANTAVNREASALRAVVLLAPAFGGASEGRLRTLVRRHIEDAVSQEWPAMARREATLAMTPVALAEALQLTLTLEPRTSAQTAAQREIITSLETALDARRQRIIVSRATVNWVKWTTLAVQAACTLIAIAMIQSDNARGARFALGLFATGVAVSILLIAAHNRPFVGELSVRPDVLLQVLPPGLP